MDVEGIREEGMDNLRKERRHTIRALETRKTAGELTEEEADTFFPLYF